jgi:adenylyltransferase/sulfurtransferase
LLSQIGAGGQDRLARGRVLLVGCGALGSVIAEYLVRAGVGEVRLVDRDVVEWTNLQRQTLFTEDHARDGTPKAVAAAERLREVNSRVRVEPMVHDLHAGNVEELIGGVNVIVDGCDNVETRELLNDVSVKHEIPWVYGACVGIEGRQAAFDPPRTGCLRCVFDEAPSPGELPTCDTVGVLGPAAGAVASLQAAATLRLLVGGGASGTLVTLDVWGGRTRSIDIGERRVDCSTCGKRQFPALEGRTGRDTVSLCGRNAVQVRPAGASRASLDLESVAARLAPLGAVERTPYLLRCELAGEPSYRLTVFPDGRLIVAGTADLGRARSLYARFVGA